MEKTDESLHNVCVAAIKRHTIKPYDFKWTKFYETNKDFLYKGLPVETTENEMYICSTVIDESNFSILTTRRLITKQDGQLYTGNIQGAIRVATGLIKDLRASGFTSGLVQLKDGQNIPHLVETGNASIVMTYGVGTLVTITRNGTSGKLHTDQD